MNEEIKVKCIYAGNKSDCKGCSHVVNHLKGGNCIVPVETCTEIGERIQTTVVCKKAMSIIKCNQCHHAKPHLINCGCKIVNQLCNVICTEEGK
jgi:hypothetical protein